MDCFASLAMTMYALRRAGSFEADMTELRRTFKDLLSIGVLCVCLYSFVWVLAISMFDDVGPGLALLMVPFVLMYVIRRLAVKGHVFLVLSVLLCLVSWFFLRLEWADSFVIFVLVISLGYSIYAWFNIELEPGFVSGIVFMVLHFFLFGMVSSDEEYASVYQARVLFSFLIIVCLTVLYQQMDRLDFKLYFYKSTDNLSSKRFMHINNMMGLAFAGLILVAGYLSFFFPLHLIGMFFSWLASLISRLLIRFVPDETLLMEVFGPPPMEIDFGEEEIYWEALTDTWNFAILNRIFQVLATIIIVLLVLYFLYSIVKKIKPRKKNEKLEDVQEEVGLTGSLLDDLFDLLPRFKRLRHPIRRAYEKKVNFHIKQGVMVEIHDTTEKIADKIREAEDIDDLTAKYEIIRYWRET